VYEIVKYLRFNFVPRLFSLVEVNNLVPSASRLPEALGTRLRGTSLRTRLPQISYPLK
jgi:hypothetical protein